MLRGDRGHRRLMEDHIDTPQCALESLVIAHITLNPLDVGLHVTHARGTTAHSIVEYPYPLILAYQRARYMRANETSTTGYKIHVASSLSRTFMFATMDPLSQGLLSHCHSPLTAALPQTYSTVDSPLDRIAHAGNSPLALQR